MALVPLAPCLPAWKPQALETWLNAVGTAIFLFPLHLMQPSNPWYWLLGLLAGGATWPEGFALALAAEGLLKAMALELAGFFCKVLSFLWPLPLAKAW